MEINAYSTILYRTVPYSTIQYHTVSYSTIQYRTVPYSTIQDQHLVSKQMGVQHNIIIGQTVLVSVVLYHIMYPNINNIIVNTLAREVVSVY